MRDDVPQRVVEDVPHVQRAGRVRHPLEHVEVALGLLAGRRVLSREGALRLPHGLPLLLDCLCVVRVHRILHSPPETKKPLAGEAVGGRRGPAALLPDSGKKQVHIHQCNHGFPMEPAVETPLAELLPDGASVEDGALVLGGVSAAELAREYGTPLVVYDELTLRAQASAYRTAAPDALIVYGTKAFPSVAVLQLLAEEGLGADVSSTGELEFAGRAGIS